MLHLFSGKQVVYPKRVMGKSCKVVVCGQSAVGKTAVLEQLLYANHVAGIHFPFIPSVVKITILVFAEFLGML